MFKKRSAMFVTAVLVLALTVGSLGAVWAAEDLTVDVDYARNVMDVTYTSPLSYTAYVTVYVVPQSDAAALTDFSKAVRIGQALCEAGQSVTISIKLGDDLDGRYDVFAVPSGKDSGTAAQKSSQSIPLLGSSQRSAILGQVNEAPEASAGEKVLELLKDALKLPEESCPAWKNAYIYAMKQEDAGGAFTSFSQVLSAWGAADTIHSVRTAASQEDAAAVIAKNEIPGADASNPDYAAYQAAFLSYFAEQLETRNVRSQTAYGKAFGETAAVTAINQRDVEGKAKALTQYEATLGIADLHSDIEKVGAGKAARFLDGQKFADCAAIETKVRQVVKDLLAASEKEENKKPSNSSPSYGGGSIGGRPGGGITGSVTVPVSPVEPIEPYVPEPPVFTDMAEDYWAREAIEALNQREILTGYGDGTFRGENSVTREEFVKLLVSAFAIDAHAQATAFADVPEDFWAAEVIGIAVSSGIIQGIAPDQFGVGQTVTRQDMAAMVYRCLAYLDALPAEAEAKAFTDSAAIADYAAEAVSRLSGAGYINGFEDGSFGPTQPLTRAQAAKIIYEVLHSAAEA